MSQQLVVVAPHENFWWWFNKTFRSHRSLSAGDAVRNYHPRAPMRMRIQRNRRIFSRFPPTTRTFHMCSCVCLCVWCATTARRPKTPTTVVSVCPSYFLFVRASPLALDCRALSENSLCPRVERLRSSSAPCPIRISTRLSRSPCVRCVIACAHAPVSSSTLGRRRRHTAGYNRRESIDIVGVVESGLFAYSIGRYNYVNNSRAIKGVERVSVARISRDETRV